MDGEGGRAVAVLVAVLGALVLLHRRGWAFGADTFKVPTAQELLTFTGDAAAVAAPFFTEDPLDSERGQQCKSRFSRWEWNSGSLGSWSCAPNDARRCTLSELALLQGTNRFPLENNVPGTWAMTLDANCNVGFRYGGIKDDLKGADVVARGDLAVTSATNTRRTPRLRACQGVGWDCGGGACGLEDLWQRASFSSGTGTAAMTMDEECRLAAGRGSSSWEAAHMALRSALSAGHVDPWIVKLGPVSSTPVPTTALPRPRNPA